MERVKSNTKPFEDVRDSESSPTSTLHEKVLIILQFYGPMPVQELIEKNPQFRWVDVLRAVSQLWGEGELEVEHDKGQLRIWSTVGRVKVYFWRIG